VDLSYAEGQEAVTVIIIMADDYQFPLLILMNVCTILCVCSLCLFHIDCCSALIIALIMCLHANDALAAGSACLSVSVCLDLIIQTVMIAAVLQQYMR